MIADELSSLKQRRKLITAGILAGMYLASMENTVVTTAMPTVIAKLGGLEIYSWVFSIYLLTGTVSIPVWGRLSDLHGRRRLYLIGIGTFLFGSLLCGMATSMLQLVLFRAVQGIGAGALVPIALTIIGEIYTFDERGRMQAVFSSIWGFASITGPILGGFIADHFSWRWVFWINLPIGLAASIMIGLFFSDHLPAEPGQRSGLRRGILMAISLALFLLYLMEASETNQWLHWKIFPLLLVAVVLFFLYLRMERRSEHPFIPPKLFSYKMFVAACVNGLCIGMILFGVLAFLPLFVQVVLGRSATEAGRALTPLLFTWVIFSIILGRLLRRIGFRKPAFYGMLLIVIGTALLVLGPEAPSHRIVLLSMTLLGAGMGLNALPMLMAVQSVVSGELLGIATSATQFFRSIGGAFGVAIAGSAFRAQVARSLSREPSAVAELFRNPEAVAHLSPGADPANLARFREVLGSGLQQVFLILFVLSLISFTSVLLVPREVELLAPDVELKEPTPLE